MRKPAVTPASKIQPLPIGGNWGPWRLEAAVNVLWIPSDSAVYEVDLEDCQTSAQVLDWITQIAGKSWATDDVLAGLVRALDDILAPQANLCSGGMSKRLADATLLARIRQIARHRPELCHPAS